MEADIDIELDLEALVNIDKPIPCAHSAHTTDIKAHTGNAVWMISLLCPRCGDNCRYPACNKFVSLGLLGRLNIICTKECGESSPFVSWLVDLKKL